ncbi:MAG: hypothetical protein ACERKJ_00505 [Candidatus Dadabacteria bacterium]|jgi:hypothetical protein
MTREELEKRRKTIDVLREKSCDLIAEIWEGSEGRQKYRGIQPPQMDSLLILLQGVLDELRYMNDKDE